MNMCHAQVQSSYYFTLAIKHTLFSWFTSAPLSISNWAVSVWPFSQAIWSGVCSSYKQLHVFCYCTPANAANTTLLTNLATRGHASAMHGWGELE